MTADLHFFSLASDATLGASIARLLGVGVAPHEHREFEDGEHKTRPLASVRGGDVYVLDSLAGASHESPADKLVRLAFFGGTLKDASAASVTAVLPYLAFARKDRRTKARDPVTTRYVAQMLEAIGLDRIVVLDVHNLAAYQNAFRIPAEHLEARSLIARAIAPLVGDREVAIVSPDAGGVKRADAFRRTLSRHLGRPVSNALVEKHRSGGSVRGELFAGDVRGRVAVIVDDLISTGNTMLRAARLCHSNGAASVFAVATHAAFSRDAPRVLADPAFDGLLVTNSVAIPGEALEHLGGKLQVLDVAPLLAEAVARMHNRGSLTELNESPEE